MGLLGAHPTADERAFFADADPLGFILFSRNIESPEQVRGLVSELRDIVGRDDAPVLIDQEGGRVQRLRPPHWPAYPAARLIGDLAETDQAAAVGRAFDLARLIADDLTQLGITVDCAPCLDVPQPGSHDIIGDRAFGITPGRVSLLGRAALDGFQAGGITAVIKHLPGHGRAGVDSHEDLPVVDVGMEDLIRTDFPPFTALADAPWAMTAHVVYNAVDPENCATHSPKVIEKIIRDLIGFQGVLVSDDLSMQALKGDFRQRAEKAFDAGCDLALHCNGDMAEMKAVAEATPRLSGLALGRVLAADARRTPPKAFDREAAMARVTALVTGATVG